MPLKASHNLFGSGFESLRGHQSTGERSYIVPDVAGATSDVIEPAIFDPVLIQILFVDLSCSVQSTFDSDRYLSPVTTGMSVRLSFQLSQHKERLLLTTR